MSAEGKQIRGGKGRCSRNSSGAVEGGGSGEAQDGVVELARVRTARPRLQLLAVEGVAVEVAVDDDVRILAPA